MFPTGLVNYICPGVKNIVNRDRGGHNCEPQLKRYIYFAVKKGRHIFTVDMKQINWTKAGVGLDR